jgi:hypothetical protein
MSRFAWALFMYALLEAGAGFLLQSRVPIPLQTWAPPALHALASMMLAPALHARIVSRFESAPASGTAWVFGFLLFLPVAGALLLSLALVLAPAWMRAMDHSSFLSVETPTAAAVPVAPAARALRLRTGPASHAPMAVRIRSVLALQAVPVRQASAQLLEALSEPVDDVRLIAYGILDAKENAVARRIETWSRRRQAAADADTRAIVDKTLAELYVELIYQKLAQEGEMAAYILERALFHAEQAAAVRADDAGLLVLRGRIALWQSNGADAERLFAEALRQGAPRATIEPYLAELAFQARDYAAVRRYLSSPALRQSLPPLRTVVDFWARP